MALPQDISPVNDELSDSITRGADIPWIETKPGMAWTKVLWVGQESGRWAVLLKWKKGYVAPPHKHLSAAFAYILKGRLKVRTTTYQAGDFLHETNGMVHGATEALEDTEYLFFCDGPVLFFDDDKFTGKARWLFNESSRRPSPCAATLRELGRRPKKKPSARYRGWEQVLQMQRQAMAQGKGRQAAE